MQKHHHRNRKHSDQYSYTWPPKIPAPIPIEYYLMGTPFPVSKQELIAYATGNDAPEFVLKTLTRFDNKIYQSMPDVAHNFAHYQDRMG